MTTTDPIERHANHSREMLDHAAEMIAQGDRLQASKQIWSAAAERVREIAAEREWPHKTLTDTFAIVHHISQHADDQEISTLFAVARNTHQNAYEDWFSLKMVAERLDRVRMLIALLDAAHRRLPPDLPMPNEPFYRQRHLGHVEGRPLPVPLERRTRDSRQMLEWGAELIEQGEQMRASKVIGEAAMHRLGQIAAERGWPCKGLADRIAIARHLGNHAEDRQIPILFSYADQTHQNFYEDKMSLDELAERLEDIRTLLDLLDDAHQALPPDLAMPDDLSYRQRHG